MKSAIRLAREDDASQMLTIYAPIVRETAISFETEPPSVDEFCQRIRATLEFAPWLVCEVGGQLAGYAYATRFRTRAAYQWTAEVTVYVHPRFHRRGVGRALYLSLFECLRLQGFHGAMAGITVPNPASIGLHEGLGFKCVGISENVGYKLGKWHSVGWWQLAIRPYDSPPSPLRRPSEVVGDPEWEKAINTMRRRFFTAVSCATWPEMLISYNYGGRPDPSFAIYDVEVGLTFVLPRN